MESRARIFGHAIHPILIVFPLGLFATAIIFDAIHLVSGNGNWALISFWMIAAGIVGGLAASIFGFIDYLAIPANTRAKAVGAMHGGGNVIVLILFIISWELRRELPGDPGILAILPAFAGAALSIVTGWLGGELVERLGVGVDAGANVNAPSSLSSKPADDDLGHAKLI